MIKKDQVKIYLLIFVAGILAFCSMIYEFFFAQCLAMILGSTVERYTTTVGLYLFSMGLGAWLVGFFGKKKPKK